MSLSFNPSLWHSCIDHEPLSCSEGINCYSYILDRPDYRWSVPGYGYSTQSAQKYFEKFNNVFADYDSAQFRQLLIKGAEKDGLIRIDTPIDKEGFYVALLMFSADGDDHDFHWLRRDDNGRWSHKNGWRPVSYLDGHGEENIDPVRAVDVEYPVFGSYFLVPRIGISLNVSFS